MKNNNLIIKCISILVICFFIIIKLYYTYYFDKNNNRSYFDYNYALNFSNNSSEYKPRSDKYVKFECNDGLCGGWSDRLDGIMGGLAFAIIQNRKFLIDISQPCLLTHLLDSNLIKWNNNNKNEINNIYKLYSIDNFKIQKEISTLNLRDYLFKYDMILIKNNQDWLK